MMAAAQQQQMANDGLINTSHGGHSAGFLPLSQSAAIAAAATGGQIPLVGGLSCFQANGAAQGKSLILQSILNHIIINLSFSFQGVVPQSQLNQSYFNQQVLL